MKKTVLYSWHASHGAKLVPFAGWEMPLQYASGPLEEHRLVRRSAGLFDTSHMGRFEVSGPGALHLLENILSARMSDLNEGMSRYALLLQDDGTFLDDLFVYRLSEKWLLVVNASNRERDLSWIRAHADSSVRIEDVSEKTAMIALQGPRAIDLLSLAAGASLTIPERFASAEMPLFGSPCLVGRTGYTGEDGVEIFPPAVSAVSVWDGLLSSAAAAGIEAGPAGLAARDSLRFEPGFALYGHEISEKVTPAEAGLLWACDLEKPFVGRDSVLQRKSEGVRDKLVTFIMTEKAVPREGYEVLDSEGKTAGHVVTGLYAPSIDSFAGNAYLRPDLASVGKTFYIRIRDTKKEARAVKRPLYTPAYRK